MRSLNPFIRRLPAMWLATLLTGAAAMPSMAAAVERDPEQYSIRACEQELLPRMRRDAGGHLPDTVIDARRAEIRQASSSEISVRGTGRCTRDANDRGRTFSFDCAVNLRRSEVARADYRWTGGGFDDGYDRPGNGVRPSYGANRPEGRVWMRGGIFNRNSRKSLDVRDRSTRDGASVQQWTFANEPQQRWDVIEVDRGEFAIVNEGSNKVLDVAGNSREDGGSIVQNRWRGGAFQRWRIERADGGFYRIVNVGSGRCLDVQAFSQEEGGNVQQWSCSGAPNQSWRFGR
jgi:hypothetical protein